MSVTATSVQFVLLFWTLLSFFLVALFWSLYQQLGRRPSFRWWTWSWIAYGLYYAASLTESALPAGPSAGLAIVLVVEGMAVYARAPLLFFGARCFAREDRREPRLYAIGLTVAMAAGGLAFGTSLGFGSGSGAVYLRNLPRVVLVGAALLYTAAVFAGRYRQTRSRASLVTAIATGLGGAINLAFVVLRPLRLESYDAWAYWTGVEWWASLGIALGMVYLLLEEHQRATAALRAADQRYRAFIAQSTEGIWRDEIRPPLDVSLPEEAQITHLLEHSRVAEANEAMARMYGFPSAEAMLGTPLKHFLDPAVASNREYLRGYIRSGYRLADRETQEFDAVGGRRIFSNSVIGIVENDRLVRTWGTQRDLTERRRAEQAQREADARYRMLVDTMTEGLIVTDALERIEFVNDRFCTMLGYDREMLLGVTTFDLVATPADAARLRAELRRRRTGVADRYELAFQARSGATVWTQVSGAPLKDPSGAVVGTIGVFTDISERKRAEDERDKIFLLSLDLLATISLEGQFLRVNPAAEWMLGYPPEELAGRDYLEMVHPDDRAATVRQVEGLRAGRPIVAFENRYRCGDGSYRWLSWNCAPPEEGVVYVVARDVTDRRRADEVLARQRTFLREVIDVIPCYIFLKDRRGRYVLVNRMHAELYGHATDEMVGKADEDIHADPADIAGFRRADRAVLETGRDLVMQELATIGPGGRKQWSWVIKRRMAGPDGDPLVLGVALDTTERKEAELRQAAVYRIAQAADRAADLDELFRSVHGIVREIMSARNFYIALHDERRDEVSFPYWVDECDPPPAPRARGRGLTEYVLRTRRSLLCTMSLEEELLRRGEIVGSGAASEVWVGVPLVAGGRVLGVMAVQDYGDPRAYGERDVQILEFVSSQVAKAIARKQEEEARARLQADVQRSALEWRRTFDAITSPIVILDPRGRVVRLNEAARRVSRRTHDDLIGADVARLAPGEPWRRIAELAASVRSDRAGATAEVLDQATGRRWDVSASLLEGEDDESERTIVVARDVTRLVQLQDSLRRSETMSVLGSLVAGVAHEVRNPLFSMTATLDAFEARYGVRAEYQKHLSVLRKQLGRLTALMQELLDYGRPRSLELAVVPIEDVLAQAMDACAPLAAQGHVTLERRVASGIPPCPMDRLRMVQVFANLIENAIQHAPPHTTVGVDARVRAVQGRLWTECAVRDAGPGFAPEDLPHLFEPFFTRRRGGTGLGLSLVQRIVEQHGGQVAAENQPEGGGAMRVRLPITVAEPPPIEAGR